MRCEAWLTSVSSCYREDLPATSCCTQWWEGCLCGAACLRVNVLVQLSPRVSAAGHWCRQCRVHAEVGQWRRWGDSRVERPAHTMRRWVLQGAPTTVSLSPSSTQCLSVLHVCKTVFDTAITSTGFLAGKTWMLQVHTFTLLRSTRYRIQTFYTIFN